MSRNSRGNGSSPYFSQGKAQNGTTPRSNLFPPTRNNAKRNTSILSFFKTAPPSKPTQNRITDYTVKVSDGNQVGSGANFRGDVTDSSEGLFCEDRTENTEAGSGFPRFVDQLAESAKASPRSSHGLWEDPEYEDLRRDGDEERYNENGGAAVKRRKVDTTFTEKWSGNPALQPPTEADMFHHDEGLEGAANPPVLTNRYKIQRKGPFIDESDSEDDAPYFGDGYPSAGRRDAQSITPIDSCSRIGHLLEKEEAVHNFRDTLNLCPSEKEVTDFSAKRMDPDLPGENLIVEEELAYREFAEADPEADGFEEQINPTLTSGDDNLDLTRQFSDEEIAICPICRAAIGMLTDDEATIHVNNCLDGNPTPISVRTGSKPANSDISLKSLHRAAIARPGQRNPFTLDSSQSTPSAFLKLMSGNAEDSAWVAAAANEEASRGKQAYERTCPFYKILPGFSICVDAFRYGAVEGCNAYFLSHFHSDHYVGLTSSWRHGRIYCSRVTGNLVRQQLRVDPSWVVDIEFEQKIEVPETGGVHVTMIPANHCPGSSLFLFEKIIGKGPNPKVQRILHCGDFRASPAHIQHRLLRPEVLNPSTGKMEQQRIDVCYLDTTYLNPRYAFPSQDDVISACAEMCVSLGKDLVDSSDLWEQSKRERTGEAMINFISKDRGTASGAGGEEKSPESRGRLLVVVGTYSIGKERICLGIARALKCKIYASTSKRRVCACLEDRELSGLLTNDPLEAQVHMQSLMEIRAETLSDYLASFKPHFSRVVGFRPTGWNYRPPTGRMIDNPAVSTVLHSDTWKPRFSAKSLIPQRGSNKESSCFGVPYSEHSSFRELTMFCCALRISRVIPTVNIGSSKSRERMKVWVERWEAEKRKTGLFKVDDGASKWP